MGSFCEGVLSFSFRSDTPDDVLAAFAELADPDATDAPALPAPVASNPYGVLPTDYAQDTDELGMMMEDPFPGEPWKHNWADPLSWSMGVMFVGHTRLFWSDMKRWTLSARFSLKDDPDRILRAIQWLGPFIEPTNGDQPLLLGYLRHEYQTRPLLVWHRGDRIYGEDLTEGDTDTAAEAGILFVICGLPGSGREELLADGRRLDGRAYDRYHDAAIEHDPHPMNSRYAGVVLRALEQGDVVRVSDVAFCSAAVRTRLIDEFRRRLPGLVVQIISFANDPEQCRLNVAARASSEPGHDVTFELNQIDRFSPGYVPVGDLRPVTPWAPQSA